MVASSSSSSSAAIVFFLLVVVAGTVTADLYRTNVLYPGQQLRRTDMLFAPGQYTFGQWNGLQNCNFCIRRNRAAGTWCTGQAVRGTDCYIALQRDGDLVVYGDSDNRLWSSNTAGRRGDYILLLHDNGTLVLYGDPIWTSTIWSPHTIISSSSLPLPLPLPLPMSQPPRAGRKAQHPSNGPYDQNVLYEREHLIVNEELRSKSYRLVMQPDCNLVLYNAYTSIWQTETAGSGTNCKLEMRRLGNLIVTNEWDTVVWSNGPARGDGDYILVLQANGHLVVYSKALWVKPDAGVKAGRTNKIATVVNGNEGD